MALHSMGRQHGDHQMAVGGGGGGGGASSSSIALLQARFRQLEKMREKREEMELLKLFSESQTINSRQSKQTRNLLVHPDHDEMIYHQPNATTTTKTSTTTTRSSSYQDSLSLELDLYGTEHDQPTIRNTTPPFRGFWSMDSVTVCTSLAHEKPDVDTSLHL